MNDKEQFQIKLRSLMETGGDMTEEIIRQHFHGIELTDGQLAMIMGYVSEQRKETALAEEEEAYLSEYQEMLESVKPVSEDAKQELLKQAAAGDTLARENLTGFYLREVIRSARNLHREGIFIGDLIQEGNIGLTIGLGSLKSADGADEFIRSCIEREMRGLLLETESKTVGDHKVIARVSALEESITKLEQELGRKVYLEEIAYDMGISEEEVRSILKLTGELPDEAMLKDENIDI
ncbi:hypothetical protein MCG98_13035 [Ruminococcus sp. OA3]|uniref:sigma-70 domain-containing protein n=1 Tax=Ruminococcus sp. OA3 TaxID=2914164 RepID=UPI001F052D9D|nr:sigma-70 domain-containing protein [Ruminococcus sp. OA3]MCH1983490.1 hypothetical protein [Ruminococcus sp. OA3]